MIEKRRKEMVGKKIKERMRNDNFLLTLFGNLEKKRKKLALVDNLILT